MSLNRNKEGDKAEDTTRRTVVCEDDTAEEEQEEQEKIKNDDDSILDTFPMEYASKDIRISALRETFSSSSSFFSNSYRSNTDKEVECLQYVRYQFLKRFHEVYPAFSLNRPSLPFFLAENECGCEKMVCTTIRSNSLTDSQDLYTLSNIARFVSSAIEFEPLTGAHVSTVPRVIQSPTYTLECQKGDTYDMATLLCSILLGAGFDAYCVFGTAPKWVCKRDQRRRACPNEYCTQEKKTTMKASSSSSTSSKTSSSAATSSVYALTRRFDFHSKFQMALERKKHTRAMDERQVEEKMMEEDDVPESTDALKGKRLHCWVLVKKGKREQEEHVFVEPSTGQIVSIHASPYEHVVGAWNAANYWICMQDTISQRGGEGREQNGLALDVDWDATFVPTARSAAAGKKDTKRSNNNNKNKNKVCRKWHRVFAGAPTSPARGMGSRVASGVSDVPPTDAASRASSGTVGREGDGKSTSVNMKKISSSSSFSPTGSQTGAKAFVEPPMSWVKRLRIHPDTTRASAFGSKKSKRTTLYRRSKVEEFAEYAHALGLVRRTTLFEDAVRTIPIKIIERFEHRSDCLSTRTRYPLQGLERETYAPGHPFALKELTQKMGEWIRIRFYRSARRDGLVERYEVFEKKMTETYVGRDDRLTYRSVSLVCGNKDAADDGVVGRGASDDKNTNNNETNDGESESGDTKKEHRHMRSSAAAINALYTLPSTVGSSDRDSTPIRKMAEKFDPPLSSSSSDETTADEYDTTVAKRTYFVVPTSETNHLPTIVERFHLTDHRIIAKVWSYPKLGEGNGGDDENGGGNELGGADVSSGKRGRGDGGHHGPPASFDDIPENAGGNDEVYDTGENNDDEMSTDLRRRLHKLKRIRRAIAERCERECYHAVRESKRETEDILSTRWATNSKIEIERTVFEEVRDNAEARWKRLEDEDAARKTGGSVGETKSSDDTASDPSASGMVDYLTPYLPKDKLPHEVSPDEAHRANDACLKALKERLVERANIIQRRLDKENEMLAKRQAAFQRSRDAVDGADEEYEKFCVDAMFRIQILEQRLQKHDDTAMVKYEALLRKLQVDPRLATMRGGKQS
eukprot:g3553.t1